MSKLQVSTLGDLAAPKRRGGNGGLPLPHAPQAPAMGCAANGFRPCWDFCPYPDGCRWSVGEEKKAAKLKLEDK